MTTRIPCNRKTLRFQTVLNRLQDLIERGMVASGDRLPAERQLAADLHVSRHTVREALRVLEQMGLIEIRRGVKGGAYVTLPSAEALKDGMEHLLQLGRLSLDQIVEYRETLEGHITASAAQKATSNDIRRLKHCLSGVRSAMGDGSVWSAGYIAADQSVHLCVARIAGNPLFVEALQAIFGIGRYSHSFMGLNPSLLHVNFNELCAMVDAIENWQAETAAGISRAHIARFNNHVV